MVRPQQVAWNGKEPAPRGFVKLPVDDYARGGKLAGRLLRGPLEEGS
jgi:hypothetical protein